MSGLSHVFIFHYRPTRAALHGVGDRGAADRRTALATLITLTGQGQQLTAAVQERQGQRDFLAGKVREAALKQSQSESIGYMRTLGAATTPRNQLPTRTVQVALLGAALSLLAGGVLAFVLEFLDRALRGGSKTA